MSDRTENDKTEAAVPKFYSRDKRWLISHDEDEPLQRGDYVEERVSVQRCHRILSKI